MAQNYLPATMNEIQAFAHVAARSGMFGGCDVNQAIVKLMTGASWGIPAISALSDIHVVKGKPMASSTLLRALVRQSGRYDYRVKENSDAAAEIEFFSLRGGQREHLGTTRFTIEDAQRAGLTRNDMYDKYRRTMLLARCTSEGVKAHCPDVTTGSVYYAEEWGNELDDSPPPVRVDSRVVAPAAGQIEAREPDRERVAELEAEVARLGEQIGQQDLAARRVREAKGDLLALEALRDKLAALVAEASAQAEEDAPPADEAEQPETAAEPAGAAE